MRLLLLSICFSLLWLCPQLQTVYKTPSGKKYHTSDCRMVKNVSEAIDLNTAIELGLTPCKLCNPKIIAIGTSAKKPNGVSKNVQCKGMTKKGTRCKHMTSIANGYCFQHDPSKKQ